MESAPKELKKFILIKEIARKIILREKQKRFFRRSRQKLKQIFPPGECLEG